MDERTLEKTLVDLLTRLGVTVRREQIDYGSGGYCRLDDEPLIVLPPELTTAKRVEVYLGALRRLDTSGIFIPPVIRDLMEDGETGPDIT